MITISFVLVLLIIVFLYGSHGNNCGDATISENKLLTACASQGTFVEEVFIEFSNVTSNCSCTVQPHTLTDFAATLYRSSGLVKDRGCHKELTVTHYSNITVKTTAIFYCEKSGSTWNQVRTTDTFSMTLRSSTTEWEKYCFLIQTPSGGGTSFTVSCGDGGTTISTAVQKSTKQSTDKQTTEISATDKQTTEKSELTTSYTSRPSPSSSSAVTSQSISETKDKYTQTSQGAASSDIPWEVVGGAAGGGVVAIIIIVIVIVCFCTRAKSERSKGSRQPYVNNVVCEGENSSYSSVNDGYLKDNPLYNANSNTNDRTYSTDDDEKPEYSKPREFHNDKHDGTYSTADEKPVYSKPDKKGTNRNVTDDKTYSSVDERPVYAKPNKPRATKSEPGIPLYAMPNKRNTQDNESNSTPPVYAEVNKANKKQSKALEPVRTVNQDGLVYMEVESNKNNDRSASNSQQTSNNEGTVYAEMKTV